MGKERGGDRGRERVGGRWGRKGKREGGRERKRKSLAEINREKQEIIYKGRQTEAEKEKRQTRSRKTD